MNVMDVNVSGIGFIGDGLITTAKNPKMVERTSNQVFEDFLKAATGIYTETNSTINAMEKMQLDIATGESDDFIGLTLMQSKANASMQFITQLTNKTVESYREIMRMQV